MDTTSVQGNMAIAFVVKMHESFDPGIPVVSVVAMTVLSHV